MNKKALLVAAVAIPSLVVAAIVIAEKGGNMKLSEKGANLIKQYEGLR